MKTTQQWYEKDTFDEEYAPRYSPVTRILIGTTVLLFCAGCWYFLIWSAVEGYKYVGK